MTRLSPSADPHETDLFPEWPDPRGTQYLRDWRGGLLLRCPARSGAGALPQGVIGPVCSCCPTAEGPTRPAYPQPRRATDPDAPPPPDDMPGRPAVAAWPVRRRNTLCAARHPLPQGVSARTGCFGAGPGRGRSGEQRWQRGGGAPARSGQRVQVPDDTGLCHPAAPATIGASSVDVEAYPRVSASPPRANTSPATSP